MRRVIAALTKVLLAPFRLLLLLIVAPLAFVSRPVGTRVDSSPRISNVINQLSSSMATQRGLLLMVGTVLLIVSLVMHGVILVLMVSTDSFDQNLYWLCIPFTLLHLGVLAGFTGAMLATPLGQGYKDK